MVRINEKNLKLYDKDYKKNFTELEFVTDSKEPLKLQSSKIIYDKIDKDNRKNLISFLDDVLKDSIIEVNMDEIDGYEALKLFIEQKQLNSYIDLKNIDLKNIDLKNIDLKKGDIDVTNTEEDISIETVSKSHYGLWYCNPSKLPSIYYDMLKGLYPTLYKNNNPTDYSILSLYLLISLLRNKNMGNKKVNIDNYINYIINKLTESFYNNYINNLVWDYHTKDININVKNLKTKTKEEIKKYMELLKEVLYDLQSIIDKVLTIKKDKVYEAIINEIKKRYSDKVKESTDLSLGILVSVLYDYDKKHPFNVPNINDEDLYDKDLNGYLDNNNITLSELVTEGSFEDGQAIYYSPNTKTFIIHDIMGMKDDTSDRLVMTRNTLKNMNIQYKKDVCVLVDRLNEMYKQFEVKKIKYLLVISWLIEKNQKNKIVEMEKTIKKEFNDYLKKVSGDSQSNPLIIRISKSNFSQIIYDLQNTLLKIIGSRNKLGNVVRDYNDYIEKYSIWVLYILDSLGTFSDNKQEVIFESIFSIFLDKKVINKWVDGCKKSRLNFYLPIKTKDKQQFINLVSGKRLSSGNKNKLNNFVIVKPRSFDDGQGYFYWDSKVTRLGKDPYDITSTVLRKYLQSVTSMNMNNSKSFFMKSINGLCSSPDENYSYNQNDVLKEKMNIIKSDNNLTSLQNKIDSINHAVAKSQSLKQNCKNFISLEQLIQEIIKYKYPLDISPMSITNKNQNKVKKLDSLVREEQKRLVKIIQNRNKNKNI